MAVTASRLLVGVVLLGTLGCGGGDRRGDPDLQLTVEVEPHPPTLGDAVIRVDVADVDWRPRNGDRVIVRGLRDGIVVAEDTARGEGVGRYVIPDFLFPVAGHWVLTARVETRDGRWAEVDRRVEVAGEAGNVGADDEG